MPYLPNVLGGVGKIFKSQNELKSTFSDVKWAYKSIGVFDLVLFLCLY